MTQGNGSRSGPKYTMKDTDIDGSEEQEPETHPERVRSQMETNDMGAIMARFYRAVSWRDN